ncbi:MAG: PIG-L deacetylase family protein [Chloroflexota bacterium]
MDTNETYIPESVMAIFAHPDDIEFGCAGTVAKWVKEGARAAYVLVTSGDVGIAEPGMTKARAAEIREAETLDAAKVAGVTDVTFFREPDCMVENTMALRKQVVAQIRRFRPEVVIAGDPTMVFTPTGRINHPDHRAVAGAVVDAIFPSSGQPNLFQELEDEGLFAHKVRKVYVQAYGSGDGLVDISDTIETKIEALIQHKSQIKQIPQIRERMMERASERAKDSDFQYAEAFRIIHLESDEVWEKQKERYRSG